MITLEQKVSITQFDGDFIEGVIYLQEIEGREEYSRLQDIVNDERKFLPVQKLRGGANPNYKASKFKLIHKDMIAMVEPIKAHSPDGHPPSHQIDRQYDSANANERKTYNSATS